MPLAKLALLLIPAFAIPQPPPNPLENPEIKAAYAREAALRAAASHILDSTIQAHGWSSNSDRLWFVRRENQRPQAFVVDLASGQVTPAFDQDRLLPAYRKAAQKPQADHIPVLRLRLTPDPGQILVLTLDGLFSVNPATHAVTTSGIDFDALPALPPDRATRRTGPATVVVFRNERQTPVSLFWVTEDSRKIPYGHLAPGETRVQSTYVGHVWLVRDHQGQDLMAFDPETERSLARITNAKPAPPVPLQNNQLQDNPWTYPQGITPTPNSPAVRLQGRDIILRQNRNAQPRVLATSPADDPFIGPLFLAPDGKTLAVFQQIPEQERIVTIVQSTPPDQLQPKLIQFQYLKPGDRVAQPRLRFIDLATGHTSAPADHRFQNLWSAQGQRWLPGNRFAALLNHRGHQKLELLAFNPENTPTLVQTLALETSPTFIDWTNKVQLHISPNGQEAVWMTETSGYAHLQLLDLQNGQVKRNLTNGPWVVRQIQSVDWDARHVLFSFNGRDPDQDPYNLHLARTYLDRPETTPLTSSNGHHSWSFSPDRKHLLATHSRPDAPPTVELRRASDGQLLATLARPTINLDPTRPSPHLAQAAQILQGRPWPLPQPFTAKGRDGLTDIHGLIFRPSTFQAADNLTLPVIENIYAGPHGAHVPKSFHPWHESQRLAELGYIVVQIDGMGTNHRGKAFHDVAFQNLKDAGFPDRIAWIKAAAAKHPEIDHTRVGIYGTSAGGQSALGALLFHPGFYQVAVSDCGCHDNRMDKIWWNEQWMGYPVGPQYEASSNTVHAKNLQGKLLLMVGEIDTNVDPASTIQVVHALIQANKTFDFLLAPNVGHGVLGTEYGRKRMEAFFLQNLPPTPRHRPQ